MQTAANINRFLTDVFSFSKFADSQEPISNAEFYQQFTLELIEAAYRSEALSKLGDRLVILAEQSHVLRRMDILEQVSRVLVSLPLPRKYETIGRYYEGLGLQRFGCGDVERAGRLFEQAAEEAPLFYRVRAMQSLAANSRHKGDYRTAMSLYHEAGRISARNRLYDSYTIVGTKRMVAIINSLEGDHRGALAALEKLFPLAHSMRRANPQVYYDYLNSLAVELAEVGRLEEARNVSRIALASPFANAYPEWRETWDEIELRGYRAARTFVSLNHSTLNTSNVLQLPLSEHSDSSQPEKYARGPFQQQASVTSLQEWKRKMVKEPNGDQKNDTPSQDLDDRQMLLKIVELSTTKGLPDEALKEMVDAIENIVVKYTKNDDQT